MLCVLTRGLMFTTRRVMGGETRFKASIRIRDAVFGNDRIPFEDECPYGLLFNIFYDRRASPHLGENTSITVEHKPSGARRRIKVNFRAVDESDFSTLVVLNEAAYDRWIEEVEPATPT